MSGLLVANDTLNELLSAGQAALRLQVHCPQTYYRRSFPLGPDVATVSIGTDAIFGSVELELNIVAVAPIASYRPAGIHADYGSRTFPVEVGDILAVGPTFKHYLDWAFDALRAPVSSFMRVRQGDFESGPFNVVLDSQKIVVEFSRSDWKAYRSVAHGMPTFVHVAVVLPALQHALGALAQDPDEYAHYMWSRRLSAIIAALGMELEGAKTLELAQHIIRLPFGRAATAIGELRLSDEQDG